MASEKLVDFKENQRHGAHPERVGHHPRLPGLFNAKENLQPCAR